MQVRKVMGVKDKERPIFIEQLNKVEKETDKL